MPRTPQMMRRARESYRRGVASIEMPPASPLDDKRNCPTGEQVEPLSRSRHDLSMLLGCRLIG